MLISPEHMHTLTKFRTRSEKYACMGKIQYELMYTEQIPKLGCHGPNLQNAVNCPQKGKSHGIQGHLSHVLGLTYQSQADLAFSQLKPENRQPRAAADSDREAPSPEAPQTDSGTER